MAKFPYSKLNAKVNQEVVTITVDGTTNPIEVRQYLPVDEKLALIGRVIELAHDSNNFANPLKMRVYYVLEVINAYTNISFTEKQLEAPNKLYDALLSSGWIDKIFNAIPRDEECTVWNALLKTVNAFYSYRNSAYGILDAMQQDYDNVNFNLDELSKGIKSDDVQFLKDVLGKLG